MADLKFQLDRLRARIEAQNGTVLDNVQGVVELDDRDDAGKPRLGPVLVLRSIEEGAQLKLAHPRPVTVLGSLSGQVFGAYRVKAGNLLSGRLEGVRHVEIVHNLGSKGTTNTDSWIVFEATSDPGFFSRAQQGLDRLRQLEKAQMPQRESVARQILLRSLKNIPYDIRVFVQEGGDLKTVFALLPGGGGKRIRMNLKALLRYLVSKAEKALSEAAQGTLDEHFEAALRETIAESLRVANSGGIGSELRRTRGAEVYVEQIDVLADYLKPKLLKLWLEASERFLQQVIDTLAAAPMVLKVDGQLAPFFQIEYPRWRFHVTGGKIVPEKVADCNIACQLGDDRESMQMTYSYVGDEDWISQTCELALDQTKKCSLILKEGSVFLSAENNLLFGPDRDKGNGEPA